MIAMLLLVLVLLVAFICSNRWRVVTDKQKELTAPCEEDLIFGPDFGSLPGFLFAQLMTGAEEEGSLWEFPRDNLHPLEVIG